MDRPTAMTEETVRSLLEEAGTRVMSRSGRSEHYGAPREFTFEVKALFPNGMGLHILARQFTYRYPWETEGRVNDSVDVSLLRDGEYSELPKGYAFFQGRDEEGGIDEEALRSIVQAVKELNPKLYALQKLTGEI